MQSHPDPYTAPEPVRSSQSLRSKVSTVAAISSAAISLLLVAIFFFGFAKPRERMISILPMSHVIIYPYGYFQEITYSNHANYGSLIDLTNVKSKRRFDMFGIHFSSFSWTNYTRWSLRTHLVYPVVLFAIYPLLILCRRGTRNAAKYHHHAAELWSARYHMDHRPPQPADGKRSLSSSTSNRGERD